MHVARWHTTDGYVALYGMVDAGRLNWRVHRQYRNGGSATPKEIMPDRGRTPQT
jgi:hypothetical protein